MVAIKRPLAVYGKLPAMLDARLKHKECTKMSLDTCDVGRNDAA